MLSLGNLSKVYLEILHNFFNFSFLNKVYIEVEKVIQRSPNLFPLMSFKITMVHISNKKPTLVY